MLHPSLSATPIHQPHSILSRPVPLAAAAGCARQRRQCGHPTTCALPAPSRAVAARAAAASGGGGSTAGNGSTNGSSLEAPPPPAGPSDNGGNGSSGGAGGNGGRQGQPSGDDSGGSNGNGRQPGFSLPFSSDTLSYAVLALTGLSALLLFAALRQSVLLRVLDSGLQTVYDSLGGMADGESTRDSVAALKRLLREVFAEQLTIKQRLTDAEKAAQASAQLEAADDYQLRLAQGGGSSWCRAPACMSGHVVAAGVLPWSQEANASRALSMLSRLGVRGAADARLQLHSVLAGGKRRITAEFCQAAQDGAAAALKLQSLLFRVQVKEWLKVMIAPLGGGLEALCRSITPVRGDFGCTQALRHGHGLTVLQQHGSGKAVSLSSRRLSASAGLFVGGDCKTGVAHLQAKTLDGHSLSLVAANSRLRQPSSSAEGASHSSSSSSSSSIGQPDSVQSRGGLQFLGVQSPHRVAGKQPEQLLMGNVLGAAGVLALTDSCTATAWAQKPLSGRAGWGLGLYCQPDEDGLELGVAVGKPSAATAKQQQQQDDRLVFCELSTKVPVGDGLSISPCAVFTHRGGASSLAYVMQSCWRF